MSQEIDGQEILHRRIHITWVKKSGKISSAAFSSSFPLISSASFNDREASVDRASLRSAEDTLKDTESLPHGLLVRGVAGLPAEVPQSMGLTVVPSPIQGNPAHAHILGCYGKKAILRKMSEKLSWVIHIKALLENPALLELEPEARIAKVLEQISPS